MKYFIGRVKETICGYENICEQLITARNYNSAMKRLTLSVKEFRGKGVSGENEEGVYDFGNGIIVEVYDLKEISKDHYDVLGLYI